MGSSIEAGRAFLRLLVDDKEFAKGLEAGLQKLDSFGKSAIKLGSQVAGIGAAITTPLLGSVAVFAQVGSALNDLSERTGVPVEKLSELKFAAEQSGTSLESVERALRFMAKTGQDVRTFDQVVKTIAAIKDPTERARQAIEHFGRAGTELIPLGNSLDESRDKFQKLGLVMSTQAAKDADTLGDAFDALKAQGVAVAVAIGAALAPAATKLLDTLSPLVTTVIEFINNNHQLVIIGGAVGAALLAIGSAAIATGLAIQAVAKATIVLREVLAVLSGNVREILTGLAAVGVFLGLTSWLDYASGAGTATAATLAHSSAQKEMQAAIAKTNEQLETGTAAINKQAAARAQLTAYEKEYFDIAQRRLASEAAQKPVNDARITSIEEEIRGVRELAAAENEELNAARDRQARLLKERESGGSAAFQARVAQALKDNEAQQKQSLENIAKLREREGALIDRRDRITGDDVKKRQKEEKDFQDQLAKQQEEASRKREELAKHLADAQSRRQELFAQLSDSVQSQFDSFSRPSKGTFSGQNIEQIFGRTTSDTREERQVKLNEKMLAELQELNKKFRDAKPLIFGPS